MKILVKGYENASAVVSGWMNSEGHKANILSTVSTRASVSCYVEKKLSAMAQELIIIIGLLILHIKSIPLKI